MTSEGCFFAKVDLKSAYRSVRLSEHSQKVTGLKWNFNGTDVYLKDTRLCFGAKLSQDIFHCLTQAVKRMMGRRGYDLFIIYLDDFLIISDSKEKYAAALNCLLQLLRKLGFAIHWSKVVDPLRGLLSLALKWIQYPCPCVFLMTNFLALDRNFRNSYCVNMPPKGNSKG